MMSLQKLGQRALTAEAAGIEATTPASPSLWDLGVGCVPAEAGVQPEVFLSGLLPGLASVL